VAGRLGELEAQDQIWAAKWLVGLGEWVDAERIGIWGWSYGGYLTAKVVEVGDEVIAFGMSTAPVSDWRLYDSMYTERYMQTPELNPDGYAVSGVRQVDGFKKLRGSFLIQHGGSDDNGTCNSMMLIPLGPFQVVTGAERPLGSHPLLPNDSRYTDTPIDKRLTLFDSALPERGRAWRFADGWWGIARQVGVYILHGLRSLDQVYRAKCIRVQAADWDAVGGEEAGGARWWPSME
jgi:hypothetical protein